MINFIKKYYSIALWPALVLLAHFIVTFTGLYAALHWLDTPMHFFGGASIAISTYYILRKLPTLPQWATIIIMLGATGVIAIGWEWLEFILDFYFQSHHQASMFDTMKDLFLGLLGASIVSLFKIKSSRK